MIMNELVVEIFGGINVMFDERIEVLRANAARFANANSWDNAGLHQNVSAAATDIEQAGDFIAFE